MSICTNILLVIAGTTRLDAELSQIDKCIKARWISHPGRSEHDNLDPDSRSTMACQFDNHFRLRCAYSYLVSHFAPHPPSILRTRQTRPPARHARTTKFSIRSSTSFTLPRAISSVRVRTRPRLRLAYEGWPTSIMSHMSNSVSTYRSSQHSKIYRLGRRIARLGGSRKHVRGESDLPVKRRRRG
jgi:hypothetical protein